MKYKNSNHFNHQQASKIGILISNLGTPESPTAKGLRPYLKQFLSDPRVVEVPRLLWWLILNGIILRIRPRRSAEAYATVWTDAGSPLAIHTKQQAEKLRQSLATENDNIIVEWAMRYGQPSIANGLQKLVERGAQKLLVLPLYPQYSAATVASTFDALAEDFTSRRWIPELRFITSYHDYPPYINALCNSITQHWKIHGQADKLIFSYHGIPLRYLHNGDPYHCQCLKTTRLVAEQLGLQEEQYLTTFQSRFGREEWLRPYTDETLKSLPGKGVKSVQVICPGFSADCLETIEEIGVENREYFEHAGGEKYSYIPALNAEDEHISALTELIHQNLQGWPIAEDQYEADALHARDQRASLCPHNQKPHNQKSTHPKPTDSKPS